MKFAFLLFMLIAGCDQNPLEKAEKERNQKLIAYTISHITTNSARVDWNCSDLEDGILTYGLTGTEFTIASLQKASLHSMEMKNLQENQTYFFKVYCGKPSSEKDFSLFLSNPFQTLKGEVPTPILSKEQIQRGIWILGGIGSSGEPIAEVDFYDPVEKKWYPNLTRIPTPRKFAGIVSNNGKIYVMGGMVGTTTVSLVEELSIGESYFTWKTMNPMPTNLQGFLVDSNGNDIYLLGGSTTNNMQLGTLLPFTIYRFQPRIGDLGAWATITTSQALYQNIDLSGCILDGTFFLGAGRYFNDGSPQNFLNGYVIGSNTTTTLSEANATYFHHGSASVCYKPLPDDSFPRDTKAVFIIGGSTQSNLAQPATAITSSNNWNYYQPLTNTMSVGSPLPTSLYFPATEISYQTRTLFLFGGASIVNVPVSTVFSLNLSSPTTNAWLSEESMPRSRYGHKAVILSR